MLALSSTPFFLIFDDKLLIHVMSIIFLNRTFWLFVTPNTNRRKTLKKATWQLAGVGEALSIAAHHRG